MRLISFRVRSIAIVLFVGVLAYAARNQHLDDALIYARYMRNALAGSGLVFNAGEHVNALTSPLYCYLLLSTSWLLHGHILTASVLLSAIFLFVTCILAERLAPYAGLLIASTAYFYSLLGLETALFLCLLVLTVTLYLERRVTWLPTVMVLLLLTRAEGLAMVVAVSWMLTREKVSMRWRSFSPPALLLGFYFTVNHVLYDRFFPSSAGAKLGQGRSGLFGSWPWAFFRTLYQLKPDFRSTFYIVALIFILAAMGIWKMRGTRFGRVAFPFLVMFLGFYLLFNIPGYRWYYAPLIALPMIYASMALTPEQLTRWQPIAILLILASAVTGVVRYHHAPLDSTNGYLSVSQWLNQNTPKNARIEAGEIGTLGFYTDRYLIDILGLTEPKNAEGVAHHDLNAWLAEDHPDYIVVHTVDTAYENVAKASPLYQRVPINFGPMVYVLQRKSPSP